MAAMAMMAVLDTGHGGFSSSKMAGAAESQQQEGPGAAKRKVSNVKGCMCRYFSYNISPITSAFNQQRSSGLST